jgi:transposase-like protein
MNPIKNPYIRNRFPPEVISHAVWLYHRFTLSFLVTTLKNYINSKDDWATCGTWMRYLSLLEERASNYGVRLTKMEILLML